MTSRSNRRCAAAPRRIFRAMDERATDLADMNFQLEATRLADHPCVVIFCACIDTREFYLAGTAMNADMGAFLRGDAVPMPEFVALATPARERFDRCALAVTSIEGGYDSRTSEGAGLRIRAEG